jgi:type II secretory pathway pseudopilin PulG
MLDPSTLERRFHGDLPVPTTAIAPAIVTPKPALTQFQLAVAAIFAIAALAVVIAAVRMTDRAVYRAVEAREAPARFLADELRALRLMAMTSPSPVPARLYLGIEECFKARVAVPFDEEHLPLVEQTLSTCADMEIGRLYAQGGASVAAQGRLVLRQAGVSAPYAEREASVAR